MNLHLAEISTQVAKGAGAAVIRDGAGWHQVSSEITLPENVVSLPLPPYSPELNPMENVWDYLRGNQLSAGVWDSYEEILDPKSGSWLANVYSLVAFHNLR
jgi:transposase